MPNHRIEIPIQGLWNYQGLAEYRAGNLRKGVQVRLVSDPYNSHDLNAVEVRLVNPERMLGYVPRTQAIWIRNYTRYGNGLTARIVKVGVVEKYKRDQLYCIIEIEVPIDSSICSKSLDTIKRDLSLHDKRCGVYEIYCRKTQKRYIGSAKDIGVRFRQHFGLLVQNRHHSEKLQHDWNQHLHSSFEFNVVEVVSNVDSLLEVEQSYLDKYNSFNDGYNSSPLVRYKPRGRWGSRRSSLNEPESDPVVHAPHVKEVSSKSGCLSTLLVLFAVGLGILLIVAAAGSAG